MPPLGKEWFRSSNGSKHGNADKENGKSAKQNVNKPLITQEDLELEYLNEISRLTREKEDARDEIEKQSKDNAALNSSLRDSNETLQLKVAELEAKLTEARNTNTSNTSISSDSRNGEVGSLKAKLAQYNETNKALHAKIQKLKQRRRDGDDDYSEVSSVGSLSLLSLQTKSSTTQMANNLLELQTKYDNELSRNKELEQELHDAEVTKNNSEKILDELKAESAEVGKQHREEIEKLQNQLHTSKQELIKLKAAQSDGSESMDQIQAKFENSQLKVLDLEKEILDKKRDIEVLEEKLKSSEDSQKKIDELHAQLSQFKNEISEKGKMIKSLEEAKLKSEQELKQIEELLLESKKREDKVQQELRQLKADNTADRSKTPEVDNTQHDTKPASEMKAAFDALQKKFAEETLLNASLKEELKELGDQSKKLEEKDKSTTENNNAMEKSESSQNDDIPINEIMQLKAELKARDEKLSTMSKEMEKLKSDRENVNSTLQSVETTLVETKLKNVQQMEELDNLQSQLQHQKKVNEAISNNDNSSHGNNSSVDNNKVLELEKTVTKKNLEIKILGVKTRDVVQLTEKLKKAETELAEKTKEIGAMKAEKHESTRRLETLELDFAVTQQKGAKTWEELEDLKEKFEIEGKIKSELQNKLKRMDSVDKLVGETKRLSEAALKERDKEIDKLKKQLTEASIAKKATEKKLIAYKNDSVAQESSRELMKKGLEEQLETENEKVMHLENLIVSKEDSIEKTRADFDILIKNTQEELQKKRNQITELNGEVLEKANQLAMRDRDLQYLKGEMDDLQLRHSSEVARLRKDLDGSVDKVELERLRKMNDGLEQTILTLNQEIGTLRAMFVNQPENDSEGTVKVLRVRNEKLKRDIEKLARKLYQLKKGRKEI